MSNFDFSVLPSRLFSSDFIVASGHQLARSTARWSDAGCNYRGHALGSHFCSAVGDEGCPGRCDMVDRSAENLAWCAFLIGLSQMSRYNGNANKGYRITAPVGFSGQHHVDYS